MSDEVKVVVVEAGQQEQWSDEEQAFVFKAPSNFYKKVNWLTILYSYGVGKKRRSWYNCVCDCGKPFTVRTDMIVKFTEGRQNFETCIDCLQSYKALPSVDFKWIAGTKYAVSSEGMIWSSKRDVYLTPCTDAFGYSVTKLGGSSKLVKIHRVVAEVFLPNPENKPQVNHKDGDKSNNKVSNLEWVTEKENVVHAFATGLKSKCVGESNHNSKISKEEVIKIREAALGGVVCAKTLAGEYGVNRSTIRRILKGVSRTLEFEDVYNKEERNDG